MMEMELNKMSVPEKVFQQFGTRFLRMACWTWTYPICNFIEKTDSIYHPSPDWVMVRACRLVSKEWNNLISAVFRAEGKPLLIFDVIRYPPDQRAQMEADSAFQVLSRATTGLLTDYRSSTNDFPPVKLALPISVFYIKMTGQFITIWETLVPFLIEIDFDLPADATINLSGFLQPMENLKKVKLGSTGQKIDGHGHARRLREFRNHPKIIQSILSAAKNVTSFTLHHSHRLDQIPSLLTIVLPTKVEFLDVPLVNNDCVAGQNCLETVCDSLKHLIIRSPTPPETYNSRTPFHLLSVMKRYASSLEVLELAAYVNVTGDLEPSRYAKLEDTTPFRIEMKEKMPNLHTLKVQGACWEISQMESYQRNLPALKNLKLVPIFRPGQIEPLYKSKSETVESLMLCCLEGIPLEMILRFAMNFPILKKLCVVVMEFDDSLKACFREFLSLMVLHVLCGPKFDDVMRHRDWVGEAVSGIPADEQNALTDEKVTLSDVMERYGKSPSLRNLKELEEFKLLVKDQYGMKNRTDVSVMVRTTFFKMPKLKRVILSVDTLQISEYQNKYIRKENVHGLKIEWHYSHRFEEYHDLF